MGLWGHPPPASVFLFLFSVASSVYARRNTIKTFIFTQLRTTTRPLTLKENVGDNEELDRVLGALSDSYKIRCLGMLGRKRRPAEVAVELGKQRSTIQRYVEAFRDAKLIDESGNLTPRAQKIVPMFEEFSMKLSETLKSIGPSEAQESARQALSNLLEGAPTMLGFDSESLSKLREAKQLLEKSRRKPKTD